MRTSNPSTDPPDEQPSAEGPGRPVPRATARPVRNRTVPPVMRAAAWLLRPLFRLGTRLRWAGAHHLPRSGGVIAVSNHVCAVDPVTFGHFLYNHGAPPRFLAKHTLFAIPVFGSLVRAAGQIPVVRGSAHAAESLNVAREALAAGNCVALFPEGTFTRDPQLWPMTGRSGVGRLALETRLPVVPVGQWGAQRVLARYGRRLHVLPRKTITVHAGPPIDLSDLYERDDPAAAREATERIMAALTAIVADLRGEQPPDRPWDVRRDGDPQLGPR